MSTCQPKFKRNNLKQTNNLNINNMKTMKYKLNEIAYTLCSALIMCLIMQACESSSGNEVSKNVQKNTTSISNVLVSAVDTQNIQSQVNIAGVAKANQEVKIYAMSNGYVQSWRHDIGDVVRKDEILAQLSNPELQQEQLKAQAQLNGDKAIYDRLESVYKETPELTPLQQVDEAKAKYESAVAQLNAINSQIEYLTVKTPFCGIITKRYIDTGAVVQDGLNRPNADPLFTVQDISTIRVCVDVPEVNSPYIVKGTPVKITFPDLPDMVYNAKVSRISYGLSVDTKTMQVQIDINNKDEKIHPEMFANVTFNIASQPGVICVPNQAIAIDEQQPYVYKVVPLDSNGKISWTNGVECRLHKIAIKVGVRNVNNSEVDYSSLKPGDRIVVSGKGFCTDGALVIAKGEQVSNKITAR